jgi:hypothetical protein
MYLRWGNGSLIVGHLLYADAWGAELVWGRRDLLGETVGPGDLLFADRVTFVVATGQGVFFHGSVWRAAVARIFQRRR